MRGTDVWMEVRLDRDFADDLWFQLFPMAKRYNLEVSPSDHCPIFLEPKCNVVRGRKHFQFENVWMTEPFMSENC